MGSRKKLRANKKNYSLRLVEGDQVMSNVFKVACFDMDGTLITNTNSVQYLCELSDNKEKVDEIQEKEDNDEISWIEADYLKGKLFEGLEVEKINEEFDNYIDLIQGIKDVITKLKENNIKSILVTAGPIQVAEVLRNRFDFDNVYGSIYEINEGKFTGKIVKHLGDTGKVESLKSYCEKNSVSFEDCVAIGDSASDIKVFEKCKKSIAINYSQKLLGLADVYLITENLCDVLKHII